MACGIGSAVESCILTSQYPQGLAAWQSGVQWALPSADRSVPPGSKSKRSKVSVYDPSKRESIQDAVLRNAFYQTSIAELPRSRLRLIRRLSLSTSTNIIKQCVCKQSNILQPTEYIQCFPSLKIPVENHSYHVKISLMETNTKTTKLIPPESVSYNS